MTLQKKIEKKGYNVTYMSGMRNGQLSIVGVALTKDGDRYFRKVFKNITAAYKWALPHNFI